MRGEELSNDSATSYMVIKDVLEKDLGVEYDYFVLLQPTSPFRNYQHINESIEKFEKNISNYDFLVSMTETSKTSTLIKPIEEDESLKHYDLDFQIIRDKTIKSIILMEQYLLEKIKSI